MNPADILKFLPYADRLAYGILSNYQRFRRLGAGFRGMDHGQP